MAEGGEDVPKNEVIDEDVLIPCEFCDRCVPISDLILHQTGCGAQQIKVSEGERKEATLHQRSEVTTGHTSEHQNKNLQEVQDHPVKTEQRITHETTDLKKTSGYEAQQKKVSKAEGREANLHQRSQAATGNTSEHENKSMQEVQDHSVKTEQHIPHESGCGAKQMKVSEAGRREANLQKSQVTTGHTSEHKNKNMQEVQDHFVKTAQRITHEMTDLKKTSSAYDDDLSDMSDDDNNPENETVEHYIWKALATAESLRKARYKSEEVGIKIY